MSYRANKSKNKATVGSVTAVGGFYNCQISITVLLAVKPPVFTKHGGQEMKEMQNFSVG